MELLVIRNWSAFEVKKIKMGSFFIFLLLPSSVSFPVTSCSSINHILDSTLHVFTAMPKSDRGHEPFLSLCNWILGFTFYTSHFFLVRIQCTNNRDCSQDKACIENFCQDPCKTQVCRAQKECLVQHHQSTCISISARNKTEEAKETASSDAQTFTCESDEDCSFQEACNRTTGICENPCFWISCSQNQECKVEAHVPTCICKRFVITEKMELVCPKLEPKDCKDHEDCLSSLACIFGKCQDPCTYRNCPAGRACKALHHAPYCLCQDAECHPTIEICIKDSGCPQNLSCIHYRCTSPCDGLKCSKGRKCLVQNHAPICKLCKPLILNGTFGECEGNLKLNLGPLHLPPCRFCQNLEN